MNACLSTAHFVYILYVLFQCSLSRLHSKLEQLRTHASGTRTQEEGLRPALSFRIFTLDERPIYPHSTRDIKMSHYYDNKKFSGTSGISNCSITSALSIFNCRICPKFPCKVKIIAAIVSMFVLDTPQVKKR